MDKGQAQFFQFKLLPIIREAAEDREPFFATGLDRNPLRPMLRQLLEYTDHLESRVKHLAAQIGERHA